MSPAKGATQPAPAPASSTANRPDLSPSLPLALNRTMVVAFSVGAAASWSIRQRNPSAGLEQVARRSRRVGKPCQRCTPTCGLPTPPPSLSSPISIPDVFAVPATAYVRVGEISASARPELLGALLWSVGLYLGLSETKRWGEEVRKLIAKSIPLDEETASSIATAVHTLPFLFAGLGIDAGIRVATEGNMTWAIAGGVSSAMYGGIYELGRMNARAKKLDASEERDLDTFQEYVVLPEDVAKRTSLNSSASPSATLDSEN